MIRASSTPDITESFSNEEAQRRFESALRGAFVTPATHKTVTLEKPKRKPAKTSFSSRASRAIAKKPPALNRQTGSVRLSISQPLAFRATDRFKRAVNVAIAEFDAMVLTEIELGKVAMQVLIAAVLIDALHALLKQAEIPLDAV